MVLLIAITTDVNMVFYKAYWQLRDMEWSELSAVIPDKRSAKDVDYYRYCVPFLQIQTTLTPVTGTIMRIKLTIKKKTPPLNRGF